ncbi:MAG: MlaD family protein [Acidimicrobiales bacterium]
MRVDFPRRFLLGFGWVAIVALIGAMTIVVAYGNGYFARGYELSALFPESAQGIFTDGGTDVKLRGFSVGTVTGVEVLDDGRARITMRIDEGVRIPQTAEASIEPLSVFGPKFIRIEPGEDETTGPYVAHGDELTNTLDPVEFTLVISDAVALFEAINPEELLTIFDAITYSVSGLGPEIGRTLDNVGSLLDVVYSHLPEMPQFIADASTIAQGLGTSADDIVASINAAADLLPTIASATDDIDHLLDVTSVISRTFGDGLYQGRAAADLLIRQFSTWVGAIYARADKLVLVIDVLQRFFGGLGDIIRFGQQTPLGRQMAAVTGWLAVPTCLVFQDIPGACDLLEPFLPDVEFPPEPGGSAATAPAAGAPAPIPANPNANLGPIGDVLDQLLEALSGGGG